MTSVSQATQGAAPARSARTQDVGELVARVEEPGVPLDGRAAIRAERNVDDLGHPAAPGRDT